MHLLGWVLLHRVQQAPHVPPVVADLVRDTVDHAELRRHEDLLVLWSHLEQGLVLVSHLLSEGLEEVLGDADELVLLLPVGKSHSS